MSKLREDVKLLKGHQERIYGRIRELDKITGEKIEPFCSPIPIKSKDLLDRIRMLEEYIGIELTTEKASYKKKNICQKNLKN